MPRDRLRARGASRLCAALALALGSLACTRAEHGELALETRALPGLSVPLPAWQALLERTQEYSHGVLQLADPGGGGRFVSLRWEPRPLDDALARQMLGGVLQGAGQLVDAEPVLVCGHEAHLRCVHAGDARIIAAVTSWSCDQDGRGFFLITFTNQPEEQLLATHRRVTAGIACHTQ